MEYAKNSKREEALKELDEALLLDADNFLIRKQRWLWHDLIRNFPMAAT
jgi:hypothetical protein